MGINLHSNISGTVALWQLQNDLTDSSGNGRDLAVSISGTGAYTTVNNISAYQFRSSSAAASTSFVAPLATAFDFTGDFTIQALIMPLTTSGTEVLFQLAHGLGGTFLVWYLNGATQSYGNGVNGLGSFTFNIDSLGTMQHWTIVKSGTSVKFFINGVNVGSTITDSTLSWVGNEQWRIGEQSGSGTGTLNAIMASVRMLNFARTPTDILTDFQSTLGDQAPILFNEIASMSATGALAGTSAISFGVNSLLTASVKLTGSSPVTLNSSGSLYIPGTINLLPNIAGTVGAWPFQNSLIDTSSNNNTLAVASGVATYTALGSVTGFDFDGTRKLEAPLATVLQLLGEFTISFLIIPRGVGTQTFIQCEIGNLLYAWYLDGSGHQAYADTHVNTILSPVVFQGLTSPNIDTWMLRRRNTGGSNYIIEIFINGVKQSGTLTTTSSAAIGTERLFIGGFSGGSNLNAIMAGLRILNFAQTDAQILADHVYMLGSIGSISIGVNASLTGSLSVLSTTASFAIGNNSSLIGTCALNGINGLAFGTLTSLSQLSGMASITFNTNPSLRSNGSISSNTAININSISTLSATSIGNGVININANATLIASSKLNAVSSIAFGINAYLFTELQLNTIVPISLSANTLLTCNANLMIASAATFNCSASLSSVGALLSGTNSLAMGSNALLIGRVKLITSSPTSIMAIAIATANSTLVTNQSINISVLGLLKSDGNASTNTSLIITALNTLSVPGALKSNNLNTNFTANGTLLANPGLLTSTPITFSSSALFATWLQMHSNVSVQIKCNLIPLFSNATLQSNSNITIIDIGTLVSRAALLTASPIAILPLIATLNIPGRFIATSNTMFNIVSNLSALGKASGSALAIFNSAANLNSKARLTTNTSTTFSAIGLALSNAKLIGQSLTLNLNSSSQLLSNPALISLIGLQFANNSTLKSNAKLQILTNLLVNQIGVLKSNAFLSSSSTYAISTISTLLASGKFVGLSNLATFAKLIKSLDLNSLVNISISNNVKLSSKGVLIGLNNFNIHASAPIDVIGHLQTQTSVLFSKHGTLIGPGALGANDLIFLNGILYSSTFTSIDPGLIDALKGGLIPIVKLSQEQDIIGNLTPVAKSSDYIIDKLIPITKS